MALDIALTGDGLAGLTAWLSAALPPPANGRLDRGCVFTALACAITDGAQVISDFRVMSDQDEGLRPGRADNA